ncbi:hypothetical protein [Flavobacterium praedii]|uniref:hypothetical protein n=1 Tax=Flavobacterium praedii TaxID=3002900 RepID=UPI00248202B5|nr:hypothetical protein [Flavobacterium praedii]
MNTKTLQKLDICPQQYESMIFNLYSNWCESVATDNKEFQKILASSAVNRWFLMELAKCETEFHLLTDRYVGSNVTPLDFNNCHRDCVYKLNNIRPTALLKEIKKIPKGIPVLTALNAN